MNVIKPYPELRRNNPAHRYQNASIYRYEGGVFEQCFDPIVQEKELHVRVDDEYCYSTTCSPWNIEELVIGYMFSQNLINNACDIKSFNLVACEECINVTITTHDVTPANIESNQVWPYSQNDLCSHAVKSEISAAKVIALVNHLETQSELFSNTGGVHGALLVDGQTDIAWFEDIGRHNALDKLIGWCLKNNVDTSDKCLVFTGRMPYEVIKKLAHAGISMVLSPGAPTSLSIEIAKKSNITLIGFVKRHRFNIYTHASRVYTDLNKSAGQTRIAV